MKIAASLARIANRLLNAFLVIVIASALLLSCYSIWDAARIYNSARPDKALLSYKPTDSDPQSSSQMKKLSPDVVAWLTVDDTGIDYPVVQGEDNSKYVNTNVYGEFSLSGSIFMDYRCDPQCADTFTLLYGHRMDGGLMFGDLERFLEKEFFDSHTDGMLYIPDKAYRLRIFACLSVDAFDSVIFNPQDSMEPGGLAKLLDYINQNALHYREIDDTSDLRIIALSTCSDTATNGRTVVFASLSEPAD